MRIYFHSDQLSSYKEFSNPARGYQVLILTFCLIISQHTQEMCGHNINLSPSLSSSHQHIVCSQLKSWHTWIFFRSTLELHKLSPLRIVLFISKMWYRNQSRELRSKELIKINTSDQFNQVSQVIYVSLSFLFDNCTPLIYSKTPANLGIQLKICYLNQQWEEGGFLQNCFYLGFFVCLLVHTTNITTMFSVISKSEW